jgi:hypothetical protein
MAEEQDVPVARNPQAEIVVSVRVPAEIWEALETIATNERREFGRGYYQGSMSGLVRRILGNFAKNYRAPRGDAREE